MLFYFTLLCETNNNKPQRICKKEEVTPGKNGLEEWLSSIVICASNIGSSAGMVLTYLDTLRSSTWISSKQSAC